MSSKRAIRRRACKGKKRHPTMEGARIHAGQLNDGRKARWGEREYVMPYHCKWCGLWHVGHPPVDVRTAIEHKGSR